MQPRPIGQSHILDARTRSGWVDERPWPSQEQVDELVTLVGDRVLQGWSQDLRLFMRHIFVKAVEDTVLLSRLRVEAAEYAGLKKDTSKLVTVLAKELAELRRVASVGAELDQVSDGLRRALAAGQFLKRELPSPAAAAHEVDEVVDDALSSRTVTPELRRLLDDVAIAVKKGRDWSVRRQMVRGLAALVEDATGQCPGRSYVSSERNLAGAGEHGWFHRLCERFAYFVNSHEAIPAEMRATRPPSMDGLVNEELKALRAEIAARPT